MRARGEKTENVYAAVEQSLEKRKFRMMPNSDREKKRVAHTFFFSFDSVKPTSSKEGCFLCQTSAPCWRKFSPSLALPIYFFGFVCFIDPRWFSDIFHVVTLQGRGNGAVTRRIQKTEKTCLQVWQQETKIHVLVHLQKPLKGWAPVHFETFRCKSCWGESISLAATISRLVIFPFGAGFNTVHGHNSRYSRRRH